MEPQAADALLGFVRGVLRHELTGGDPPARPAGFDSHPHGGAFVTLAHAGRLRGCMGIFQPAGSLVDTLESAARSTAHDPRFREAPVEAAELERLRIELSIIGELRRTDRPESLEVGRHGLWIRHGTASGCFLPQVAVARGWSAREFLSQCCSTKAGLPPDIWEDPETEVLLFEAEVLAEAVSEERSGA